MGQLWSALLFGTAAAPDAAVDATLAADLAGEWQIVPTDGSAVCSVTLGLASARGGWQASARTPCAASVPAAARVAGWAFDDGMELLDAQGAILMRFEEDETALPASPSVTTPAFFLVPAIPGFARLRQPRDWVGTWRVSAARRNRKSCVLMFGPPASRKVQAAGGSVATRHCRSTELARMKRWYVEGMHLILAGPADTQVAFAPDGPETHRSDDGRWRLAQAQR